MVSPVHNLSALFKQLGLASDANSIDAFIISHPLADEIIVNEAPFWSTAQAALLKESLQMDADWAMLVDQLNEQLHTTH